jgi:hypothetical protein
VHDLRSVGEVGKGCLAKVMGFANIHALDRAMMSVDSKPTQGERGRIRDSQFGELIGIWGR